MPHVFDLAPLQTVVYANLLYLDLTRYPILTSQSGQSMTSNAFLLGTAAQKSKAELLDGVIGPGQGLDLAYGDTVLVGGAEGVEARLRVAVRRHHGERFIVGVKDQHAGGDGHTAEEASVVGMSLNLVGADGAIMASAETDESGAATFADLAVGDYSLTTAEGEAIATLTVAEGAAQGQVVTVPVVTLLREPRISPI